MPKTVPIAFPLSSAPGERPQESGGRLINCSAKPLGQESPIKVVWVRRPGLTSFADTGLSPFRGNGILVDNLAYFAVGGKVINVTAGGVVVQSGNLAGSPTKAFFARNNLATPDIQCVVPGEGAFAVTDSSVTAFDGGGALPVPNSVCSQDGYFFWSIGDNRIFAAGPNSTVVNALTFVTAQSRNTGNLLRVVPYKGLLFAFATKFIEVYNNTANPAPAFPYSRLSVIDCGLFGRNAIAGYEDGIGAMHWVGPGREGLGVYRINGADAEKVSPPDLDRLIREIGEENADTLEAFCYESDGKNFWVLSSDTWTWELNLNTSKWNERDSFDSGLFDRWRATGSLNAFGKWLVGDKLSQSLGFVDPTSYQEFGSPMRMRLESAPVIDFPNRAQIARADFNWVTGVGISSSTTQTGRDPQVAISVSRDGGQRWDNPRLRNLGQSANSRRRVYGTNWGMAGVQGARWRLDVSDEVYGGFFGGTMSDDPRANHP